MLIVSKIGPEVEADDKARSTLIIDHDSYKRKLGKHKSKHESAPTPETEAEVNKFTVKFNGASAELAELTRKLRGNIVQAKKSHDDVMDEFVIATIVSQVRISSAF